MGDDEPDDAAAEAFEALRAEVAQLRERVEALPTEGAQDYTPTLGVIAKSLATIEAHPALRLTPQAHASEMKSAMEALRHRTDDDIQRALNSIGRASSDISRFAGELRSRHQQRQWLIRAGAVGMVAGALIWVLVSGPIARALPARWNVPEKLAAATLRLDRGQAGVRLMQTANPQGWARVVEVSELERENHAVLDDCRKMAVRTGRARRCIVTINP